MEHENSDSENDDDDIANADDADAAETVAQSATDDADHSEPDWRQFVTNYRGFQLGTTQESLTSNLFTAVKSMREYAIFCARNVRIM